MKNFREGLVPSLFPGAHKRLPYELPPAKGGRILVARIQ